MTFSNVNVMTSARAAVAPPSMHAAMMMAASAVLSFDVEVICLLPSFVSKRLGVGV